MEPTLPKNTLIRIAKAIENNERIDPGMVDPFLEHKFVELSPFNKFMLKVAALISLFFASVLVIFPFFFAIRPAFLVRYG